MPDSRSAPHDSTTYLLFGNPPKVVDFGIAKIDLVQTLRSNPGLSTTDTGQAGQRFVGTVAYASPEQCKMTETMDGQSDVYTLGVMVYEMLAGRLPFMDAIHMVLAMHIASEPIPLESAAPEVPAAVRELVQQMMSKVPRERPTMEQVHGRLSQIKVGRPWWRWG